VRVADFTLEEAADLYALRLRLEPPALRQSLRKSDDAHRREIADTLARLDGARSLEEGTDAHLAFHSALLSRCPSTWTRRVIDVLAENSQRYVLLGAEKFRSGRGPAAEHAGLCDAALAGDHDRAVALLEEHLRGTLDSVRAALAAKPSTNESTPRKRSAAR
jgi:DNA-binding GntR family transcriptional regulator